MELGYIFRIDDIVPGMNWSNFRKIENIFDKYGIKPIIGVVPDNKDFTIGNNEYNQEFWNRIKKLHNKGWTIAQHGYHHKYINKNGGILNINQYGEFAGLSYKKQLEMLKGGKNILEKNLGFKIKWWMAPAHSFDTITCEILKNLGFEYITDGQALYPFTKYGLKWLPQQIWKPQKKIIGVRTICLHINNYDEKFIGKINNFCCKNKEYFINNPEKSDYNNSIIKVINNYIYKILFKTIELMYKSILHIKKILNLRFSLFIK